ncbi:MAG: EamA family transporter [Bacteroidales bacterium]|nr:EamA family transporter [Bacteroidales bacterium]
MWIYIILVVFQALFLASGQAMFKKFVELLGEKGWEFNNLYHTTVTNWWVLTLMVLFFGLSFVLWAYVLKKMDFSQAYPLSSLSFIFGMFLAYFMFPAEVISLNRWIGVVLIVIGCVLIGMK